MAKKRDDKERVEILFDNEEEVDPEIDLFADIDDEPDAWSERASAVDRPAKKASSADKPAAPQKTPSVMGDPLTDPEAAEQLARETELAFDRYGKRLDKRKKTRYGRRKNAPKATTRLVENETIAMREYEAAKARSRQRAARREAREAQERQIRIQQRRAWLKSSLTTAGIGIGSILILAIMGWYATRIRTITVPTVPSGYTVQGIIESSGLAYGRSIVFTDLEDAKERIETDAYLHADVRYTFPSTVTIALQHRTAAACVRWGPQNEYLAIIDSKGTILNAEAETTGGLIVVEGLSVTTAQNGRSIGSGSDMQFAGLTRILQKLEELNLLSRSPRLSRIDMSELMGISIATEGANYSIEVGDPSNLDTKLMLLQKHWDEIMDCAARYIRNGYQTATIYLYSKGGVAVSPYEPGYNAAMENVLSYTLPTGDATAPPSDPTDPNQTPGAPEDEPISTPPPSATPMPNQNDPFTG